jgi:CRISPR-associated endonuclease Cas1
MRTVQAREPAAARGILRTISWRPSSNTALTISGYGVRFFVDRGRLVIVDGFANEGQRRRLALSRGTCALQRIVVLGRTGLVTLDALQWLADLGIALLFVGVGGRLTSVYAPGGLEGSKTRLHRIQAAARTSEVGVRVAQFLIGRKLLGQCQVLEWLAAAGQQVPLAARHHYERTGRAAAQLRALHDERIQHPWHLDDIIETERAGGQIYWAALSGIPLRWTPKAARHVPEHWLTTQQRESFRTGNRNGATDPTNALLNYGYALLEAETRIACHNGGIHQGLGIIHADRDGRASFVYDLMEPARPAVDRLMFEFIRKHTFTDTECWETREGYCRLDPGLTSRVAAWLPRLKSEVAPLVREVTRELAGTRLEESHLDQFTRR